MIQPKCPICSKDLMSNEGYEDQEHKVLKEPQVKYWMHDPRNLHVDVLVVAHQDCFDKVKAVHSDFDKPIQDYGVFKYPTLNDKDEVVLKTPVKFKDDEDILYAAAKAEAEAKQLTEEIK